MLKISLFFSNFATMKKDKLLLIILCFIFTLNFNNEAFAKGKNEDQIPPSVNQGSTQRVAFFFEMIWIFLFLV